MKLVKLGAAALNQTPLDWVSNKENISRALKEARAQGVSILCLPELSLSGYGCEDAFLSPHLAETSLELLVELVPHTKGIITCIGLPIRYRGALYDGVCLVADGQVLGFAAKHFLAGEGIHYESRWFTPWNWGEVGEIDFDGGSYPLGDLVFECGGLRLGFEICEDAWAAGRPGTHLAQHGVDIILNPSASHFAFAKFEVRKRFVLEGSRAFGAAYLYANLLGNESGRAIYDGGALIASGGELFALGKRFSFDDVDLVSAVVDLDKNSLNQTASHTANPSFSGRKSAFAYQNVRGEFSFPQVEPQLPSISTASWEQSKFLKEEEFARAVTLGLFDYLRKSHSQGFVVSLSGGADSTGTACLVALMVKLGIASIGLEKFLRKLSYIEELQETASENSITEHLLTCVYQATRNSSACTKNAAKEVAEAIGAGFLEFNVDSLVDTYTDLVAQGLGEELSWQEHDVSLQNIQARARGPLVWLIANVKRALLLATSNRSEAAVGYCTMDGDTCGGLSPIAGIDKAFLIKWLIWLEKEGVDGFEAIPELSAVTVQQPTAELRPKEAGQTDEEDLMPYVVLDAIERHAIRDKKSPLQVFKFLGAQFPDRSKAELGAWVQRFFSLWSRNQWKRERFAPSFHLDDENLDPKTWCRFPILSGGFSKELSELADYLRSGCPGARKK